MKSAVFFSPKITMIANGYSFLQQFNKQEVNIRDLVLDTILPVFALSMTIIIPNTVTALFCVSEQHDSDRLPE